MKTIFRKVSVKERLPEKDGDYFVYEKDEDLGELVNAMHFSCLVIETWKNEVVYWLEEVQFPTEEEIKSKARRDGSLFSKSSGEIWRDGFNECGKWMLDFVLAVVPK